MSDLIENTTKQDEVEEEQYHTVMGWLPGWAKEALNQALALERGIGPIAHHDSADDVIALCSALAAALRQVQAERGNIESLSTLVEDHRAAVKYAVRGEREACGILAAQFATGIAARNAIMARERMEDTP